MTQHIEVHPNFIEAVLRHEQARKTIAQPEEEHVDQLPIYGGKNYSDCRLTRAINTMSNKQSHVSMVARSMMEPVLPGVNPEEGD